MPEDQEYDPDSIVRALRARAAAERRAQAWRDIGLDPAEAERLPDLVSGVARPVPPRLAAAMEQRWQRPDLWRAFMDHMSREEARRAARTRNAPRLRPEFEDTIHNRMKHASDALLDRVLDQLGRREARAVAGAADAVGSAARSGADRAGALIQRLMDELRGTTEGSEGTPRARAANRFADRS